MPRHGEEELHGDEHELGLEARRVEQLLAPEQPDEAPDPQRDASHGSLVVEKSTNSQWHVIHRHSVRQANAT